MNISVSNEIDETPVGTARAEDPFGKAVFFTELAEAVPTESELISFEERV